MISPASQPNRRTRRIVVVSTLLLLGVLGRAWWRRPLVDHRFVGRWHIVSEGEPDEIGPVTLHENGFGKVIRRNDRFDVQAREFSWRLSGDRLVLYHGSPSVPRTYQRLARTVETALGRPVLRPSAVYALETVSELKVELRLISSNLPGQLLPEQCTLHLLAQ